MGGYVKVWAIGKTMLHATAASAKMAVRLAPALLLSAWTASYFFGLEIYPVTARSSPWAVYFERGEICLTSLLENRRKISEFGSGYYYIEINLASAASTRKDEILYALSARTESGGKIWAFAGFLFVGSNPWCQVVRIPAYAVALFLLGIILADVYARKNRHKRKGGKTPGSSESGGSVTGLGRDRIVTGNQ
ncbi:MAG: hypothetical protein ACYCUV_10055 [Phycisphaerae bacterium]